MKHRYSILFSLLFIVLGVSALSVSPASAGDCYADPVREHDWTGTTNIGSFVRDEACMEGSVVLNTIPKGTSVHIIGETDGWYRVEWNGTRGWVGATLISVGDKRFEGSVWTSYKGYMEHFPSKVSGSTQAPESTVTSEEVGLTSENTTSQTQTPNREMIRRTTGYILLQVENHGEAWYVNPITEKRYYMKDGPTAYEMMRSFGLGISEKDYATIAKGDWSMKNRLRGRIVLRVEEHGEAYYIHPKDLSVHYLQNGEEAYRIMRLYSLGISNKDLQGIPDEEIPIISKVSTQTTSVAKEISTASLSKEAVLDSGEESSPNVNYASIHVSALQGSWKPSNINVITLNEYWLKRINELRAKKGLSQLVLDQRFIDTATEWANYELSIGESTHVRSNGDSMHEWIDKKELAFTERGTENGWEDNYFTENIAFEYIANRMDDAYAAIDRTIEWMLKEEKTNGAHYRTIYHPDWNTVGAGFSFEKLSYNNAKVYMVFHYGSLER